MKNNSLYSFIENPLDRKALEDINKDLTTLAKKLVKAITNSDNTKMSRKLELDILDSMDVLMKLEKDILED